MKKKSVIFLDVIERWYSFIWVTVLIFICYYQVRFFDFVQIDDSLYAIENSHVRSGLSIKGFFWAFSNYDAAMWIPVTWLSLMADTSIFGRGPEGHHITNLVLHLFNTLLIFSLFSRLTGSKTQSTILAAVFAVHPLHVESVAWITERKDVLSTFFGLISIWFYAIYVERRQRVYYGLCFIALCLGLMSKALLVTWPFLFLLLDYWPLNRFSDRETSKLNFPRIKDLIFEKLPLMIPVGLIVGATLFGAKYQGAVIPVRDLDLFTRIGNALVSYVAYMKKTLWPMGLSVFYPYPDPKTLLWPALGALFLILLLSAAVIRLARTKPYLMVGWFWFLGTLVPMIGIVQVGEQAMADRFMYVPLIGLSIMVIWGIGDAAGLFKIRTWILHGFWVIVIAALTVAAHRQTATWENSMTLFQHALRLHPKNDIAHNGLGIVYFQNGDLEKAEFHYRKALDINPMKANATSNLGNVYFQLEQFEKAEKLYRRAVQLDPRWAPYRYNLGVVLFRRGRNVEAIEQLSEAIRIDPNRPEVYHYMGVALMAQGRLSRAESFFKQVLAIDPTFEPARKQLEKLTSRKPL